MPVEGFTILTHSNVTVGPATDVLPLDLTFTDVPPVLTREIQIQMYVGIAAIISVRRNGVDYPINNNIAIQGAATFTILVLSTDTLNFRTDTAATPIDVIVAG